MRVPDITLTAGNAAQFTHANNSTQQQTQSTTPPVTEECLGHNELNKNNYWTTGQLNTSTNSGHFNFLPPTQFTNSTVYTSSADEFVQRALSSSISVPYEYTNATLATSSYGDYYQRNSQTRNYLENYGSNSNSAYKGFQEVYVNRTAIALDDYEKTNRTTTKFGNRGVDPYLGEQHYENYNHCASNGVKSNDFQHAHNNDMEQEDVENTFYELNSNYQQQFINKVTTEEFNKNIKDSENYYNDQSMLDLSIDSNLKSIAEQHNDELDEYLTSPTSSSVSLGTPRRSYFPRGIINPNYPGFQHLAHTLSEHFIGCTTSDSYESDMSECEMELSVDSCDDLSNEEDQSQLRMKMNIYNNNSSSNNSQKRSRPVSPDLSNIAQENQQQQQNYEYTDPNSNSSITNNETSADQQHQLQHDQQQYQQQKHSKLGALIANELHENLRQLLTLNVPDNYSDAYIINSADNFPFRYDQKCTLVAQINAETPQVYCTTPDILLKNTKIHPEHNSKKQNRPDLLRGVSPQPLRKHAETVDAFITSEPFVNQQETVLDRKTLEANEVHNNAITPVRSNGIARDDVAGFGITPVDIIGDFEQEVEREFGLLVSGYRRLAETNDEANKVGNENENVVDEPHTIEKVSDAMLSSAKDLIDSDKYVNTIQQKKEVDVCIKVQSEREPSMKTMDFMEDNNAVDWSYGRCGDSEEMHSSQPRETSDYKLEEITDISTVSNTSSAQQMRPKYQKPSYDERQLPPVAIEYKRCSQSNRNIRKSTGQNHEKYEKLTKSAGGSKIGRNLTKTGIPNRFFNSRRSNIGGGGGLRIFDKTSSECNTNRRREEAEIHQYQQLLTNKQQISNNSRYAQMSGWAQHLKDSVKSNGGGKYVSGDLASPSALDLFNAYKIGGDFDSETLQKHLKMAKDIEKKRRSDREEIRRRLAMGAEESNQQSNERAVWNTEVQSRVTNTQLGRLNDPASDTESHSSDSETCPKLSKTKPNIVVDNASSVNISLADKPTYSYAGSGRASLSSHCPTSQSNMKLLQSQQNLQDTLSAISSEDMECDFFTKQAKLQIEARMALAQAKEMAHMQMEMERQHRRASPITDIIRVSLQKVGVQLSGEKRRVSRQMLTDMNIAQLQILVNSLHTHIEDLNESLVHNLMERDDLHVSQDSMLVDIEELTRYIGANEHLAAQRYKNPELYNHK